MEHIIAIGPREQDFEDTNGMFSGSITLYGNNRGSNISYCGSRGIRINHNVFTQDQADFVNEEMLRRVHEDPDVLFLSYDPNQAYDCDEAVLRRTLCLNDQKLMDRLNHKISFRNWAKSLCPVFQSQLIPGKQCSYPQLVERFGPHPSFVVQMDFACGGEGTFLMSEITPPEIISAIQPEELYLVSPYVSKNVPVNMHAVIFPQEILLLPPSVQIERQENHKLLYHGADYLAVDQVNPASLQSFRDSVLAICLALQKEGYRGVTGLDGMLVGEKAYILEMNNRFQGSTSLLNLALREAGLPSVQELHYRAFESTRSNISLQGFSVPYSCYTYLADQEGKRPIGHVQCFERDPDVVCVKDDGLRYDLPIAPMASLERVVFRTNIVSVTNDGGIRLHPNIPDMDLHWYHEIVDRKDLLYFKIALINQGIWLSPAAQAHIASHGGVREGVYNAVDISVEGIVINSALRVKFARLSPFSLEVSDGHLAVFCCGKEVAVAQVAPADSLQDQCLPSGTRVRDICLLATDRVRVQHSPACYFVQCQAGCKFCEVTDQRSRFAFDDVFRAIDLYLDSPHSFRHFLIGGLTGTPSREPEEIIRIAQYIRSKGDWPIYVMCVPPRDLGVLQQFHEAGVTEIAMNLELWDCVLAKAWMPGKGSIPREHYLNALRHAANIWGSDGAVRSSFVVGLESESSLLAGVEAVCQAGAAPILSVFRPIPGTFGDRVVPPDNDALLSIYQKAVAICQRYGLAPGPSCIFCQNNTLSMPPWFSM